jgi:hypothetical protein
MTLTQKGLILAAFHCLLALSVGGKLLYDRAVRPRVWVKTAGYDPEMPIRGRYLWLQLRPEQGAQYQAETAGAAVLFFMPEHTMPFENQRMNRNAPELWVEVTIPHKGPPRPIRLGIKKDGRLEPLEIN